MDMERFLKNPTKVLATMKPDGIADLLAKATDAYYNTGSPLMPDDVFDLAKDHLEKIAPHHPFLKQVGAPVHGAKVQLPFWMGSLDKVRDDPKQLEKWKKEYAGDVVVSDKLDGNSGLLVFTEKGKVGLYSRGDGEMGQDVSQLLPFLSHIPMVPRQKANADGVMWAIRGELIISKNNWTKISDKGANARNVVAGMMHTKSPNSDIAKHIDFVAYELLYPKMSPFEGLNTLENMGFLTVDRKAMRPAEVTMDNLSDHLVRRRKDSPYEIDGIVVMHDAEHRVIKGKNPKHAFAFKTLLTHEEAEVIVSNVEWNVSKDGYIKPTVNFPPVTIAGVRIQRATGFNASFIEKNKIGPGARVVIIRSGDVIPHIVRVTQPAAIASMPEMEFVWTDTHIDIKVKDMEGNIDQKLKTLEHFAKSLDIPNVAAGTLKKLVAAGYDTIPKLLRVTKDDLLKMEGFKDLSATKVANALASVRTQAKCVDLMVASNIFGRGLGAKKLDLIVKAFPNILQRQSPSMEQLRAVGGIGEATASAFMEGLPKFFKLMEEIDIPCRQEKPKAHSPRPKSSGTKATPFTSTPMPSFANQQVVFTGFRNKEWEDIIEKAGGKVTGSVSKKTTLVVAANPDENSGKVQKAKELGIHVQSKEAFAKSIGV